MQATILIPTHDHGPTLGLALATALTQTIQDLEVFIIGDGVSPSYRELIHELVRSDLRVRFFDHPKHVSRGEPYRHLALQEARGRIVCYLCDRDLWMPDHVEYMLSLLESADFANTFSLHIFPAGSPVFFPVDLAHSAFRRSLLRGENRVAFSCSAHTLDMYRRLPFGWRTTPAGQPTDLYMFAQFLAQPECRAVSGHHLTALTFPSPPRLAWPIERRLAELESWFHRIRDEDGRRQVRQEIVVQALRDRDQRLGEALELEDMVHRLAGYHTVLQDVYASRWMRTRDFLFRMPGLGLLLRALKNRKTTPTPGAT